MRSRRIIAGATVALSLLIGAAPGTASTWSEPAVVGSWRLGDPSVAVDTKGGVHIAARGPDGIWYLAKKDGDWIRTRLTRDRSAPGEPTPIVVRKVSPRIAIDPVTGRIVVAFMVASEDGSTPGPSRSIRYRVLDEDAWSRVRPIPGEATGNLDVAVRGGTIAVAYERGMYDATTIVFTTSAGSGWTTRTLGEVRSLGPNHPSLALDAAGIPHLAFQQGGPGVGVSKAPRVRYVRGSTPVGPFITETVATPDGRPLDVSLALTPRGRPRIAYATDEVTRYATRSAAVGWHDEPVGTDVPPATVDLEISAHGMPRILFCGSGEHPEGSGVFVATAPRGAWVTDVVDGRQSGGGCDLALGPDGSARVTYGRLDPTRIWFARSR